MGGGTLMHMTAAEQRAIAEITATPQEMPLQPFSEVRALWLCRTHGCSDWNKPDRTHCRTCGSVRA